MERPVHDADAVQVARADHDVVRRAAAATSAGRYSGLCERSASIWQMQIDVALARSRAAGRRCTSGRARAGRCGASPRCGPGYSLRQAIGDLPRAVRRPVVDHQHAEAVAREHACDEQRQVLALVVRRDDDEYVRRASRAGRPARPEAADDQRRIDHRNPKRSCGKKRGRRAPRSAASSTERRRRLRRAPEAPAHPPTANGSRSRYGTADAARYLAECSA